MTERHGPLGDIEGEVDEELRFHLDRRTEELVAGGLSEPEARRRAHAEFGDVAFTRAYCAREDRAVARRRRVATAARGLAHDAAAVLRQLRRRPGAVAAPMVVLALGVALNALVFTVVQRVLLAPLPVAHPDRTVVVHEVVDGGGLLRAAYPVLAAWADGATSFETVAGYLDGAYPLAAQGPPVHVPGAAVTARFFEVLPDPFLAGRGFSDDDHHPDAPPSVVLSEGLWRRAFGGDPGLVGGTVTLDGAPRRVAGVVRDAARFPEDAEVWLPLEQVAPQILEVAGAKIVIGLGVLRPGVGAEAAAAELGRLAATVPGGAAAARVVSLRDRLLGDVTRPLLLLQGAVLLVLLAACANAGGMLLTRAVRRRGEFAVRTSLGAAPGRVARSLLLEGVALGAVAGLAGVALAAGLLRPTLALVPADLPRLASVGLDAGVVGVALLLAVTTGAATSILPALGGLRAAPGAALRHASGRGGTSLLLRRSLEGLVVGQVALATVLTAGAGLLVRSFLVTLAEDPGFDGADVTVVDLSLAEARYPDADARLGFARTLLERAAGLPGAEAVAVGRNLPISGSSMTSPLEVEGAGQTEAVQVASVSAGYFEVLGIPLVDGAGFGAADREGGPPTLVVDRTLVDRGAPLGVGARARSFFGDGGPRQVVGVAGPVRHAGLRAAPTPVAYEPFFQSGGAAGFTLLVRSTAPPAVVADAARALVAELDPELPADRIGTMAGRLRASLAEPRFYTTGLSVFGALAVLLSLAGCQAGLAHRVVAQRRELGLRMALGASKTGVRGAVVRRGVALTALGAALGVALALPAVRLLESQLYGVSPHDPLTYAGLLAVLLAAAALTADVPARRAASVDPAQVLREE